jgi:hypothetical protein
MHQMGMMPGQMGMIPAQMGMMPGHLMAGQMGMMPGMGMGMMPGHMGYSNTPPRGGRSRPAQSTSSKADGSDDDEEDEDEEEDQGSDEDSSSSSRHQKRKSRRHKKKKKKQHEKRKDGRQPTKHVVESEEERDDDDNDVFPGSTYTWLGGAWDPTENGFAKEKRGTLPSALKVGILRRLAPQLFVPVRTAQLSRLQLDQAVFIAFGLGVHLTYVLLCMCVGAAFISVDSCPSQLCLHIRPIYQAQGLPCQDQGPVEDHGACQLACLTGNP